MSDEWRGGAPVLPGRVAPTPEQQEAILKDLREVGITRDVFRMDPLERQRFLREDRFVAKAVYAAILHEMSGTYKITESFDQWSREMGLSE